MAILSTDGNGTNGRLSSRKRKAWLAWAILPVAAVFAGRALGANLTWDSGGAHPIAPVDGSGNWDTLTANWSNGATDAVWDNLSTAIFGSNNGAAGTVTIDDASGTVSAAGLTFNGAGSGNYTIAASGADTLTLLGSAPVISVATGVNATISAPITGAYGNLAVTGTTATGLIIKGLGTLTLNGNNTYTGSTVIQNNGTAGTGTTVILNGSLGSAGSNVYVGGTPTGAATDTSSLVLNSGSTLTAGTLVVEFNISNGGVSTTTGSTVKVNGAATINANTITIDAGHSNGNTKGGDGLLILNSGATLTLHDAANDGGALTLLDIANYSFESGGGTGNAIAGTADFSAGTVNGNITTINIGTGKVGGSGTGAGAATGVMAFSNGTLNVGTINVARTGRQAGVGTLTLAAGGTGTINVTSGIVFGANGGFAGNSNTSIGIINVNGGTLNMQGSSITQAFGAVTGDSAVINLGGGILNLNGNSIGDGSDLVTVNAAAGTLSNVASINGTGGLTTTGTGAQVLNLTGINSYSGTTTIGGGTVIANGAQSMGTGGALVNNGGALDLNGFSQSVAGLSGSGGIITNNGVSSPITLTVTGGSGTYAGTLQNGTSSVALTLNSGSNVTLSSATAQTYTGATTVSSGATLAIANINSSSAVTVNGTLAAAGTVGSLLVDQGGSLTPGAPTTSATTGILNAGSLTIGSGTGTLNFLINSPAAFDQLLLTGTATLNGGLTVNAMLSGSVPSGNYTLLSAAGGLNLNGKTVTPNIVVAGGTTRVSASLQETATQIKLLVSGGAANLLWTGAADTTTWDIVNHQNWTSAAPIDPNRFYNNDNVTFDASSSNRTVNITAAVEPSSVTFTSGDYTINSSNGNGIGDNGSGTTLTKNGAGNVTLNTINTYAGNTTVNGGLLTIGSGGSIAGSNLNLNAGALTVNAGGSTTTTTFNISGTLIDNGTIGGTTFNLSSPGTVSVNSSATVSTTTVNINGGSFTVASSGNLSSANVTVATGASLTIQAGGAISSTANLTNNGTVAFNSDQTIGALNGTASTAVLTETGTLTTSASGTYAGAINGGNLNVSAGALVLTGTNNYSGTTTVSSGATLQIDNGANTGSIVAGTIISDSGTVIFARADNPSISNVLSGSGAFRQAGTGNMTLTADNSGFSGTIQAYNGTLIQGSPTALGSGSSFSIGAPGDAISNTTTGTLLLSASVPTTNATSISSTSSSTTANPTASVLNIPAGVSLNDGGALTVGTNSAGFTAFKATGGGSLAVSGTVTIGQSTDVATADLSGLNSVTMNGSTLNIGNAGVGQATLTLANTTVSSVAPVNLIAVSTLNMATTSTNNPSGTSILNLGSGNNTIESSAFNLGTGRGSAVIQFPTGTPSTASVTIADLGGGGSETIILANASTNGSFAGIGSFLNLAGFNANVQAASIIIAENTGNIAGGAIAGVNFDTGTFTVSGTVTVAAATGGSSPIGPTGSLIIGGATPNNTANGTFSAGNIILGDFTNGNGAAVTGTATATFTINGGTASILGGIANNSSQGNTVSTLNLNGGTLNLNGSTIGGNGGVNSGNGPITVNLANGPVPATLENLGGAGINGAGLNMNGSNTLVLAGINTFTGGVTLTSGELSVGDDTSLGDPSNTLSFNGGVLQVTGTTFNSTPRTINWSAAGGGFDISNAANTFTVNTALSGGGLTKSGAGTLVLAQNYNTTAPTVVSAGTLTLNGAGNTAAGIFGAGSLIVTTGTTAAPGLVSDGITGGLHLTVNGGLQIRSNGTATGTSVLSSLAIGGPNTLNLTNNKLILETTAVSKATALSSLRTEATSGQILATGVPANFGVAVLDNAVTGFATFGGKTVDSFSVLVSAELIGDANADGHVNLTDLSIVLNNFGTPTRAWTSGNFDGAAAIDLTDLSDVLNNFGLSNANASDVPSFGGGTPSGAPEPTSLALLCMGAVALLGRRRKI